MEAGRFDVQIRDVEAQQILQRWPTDGRLNFFSQPQDIQIFLFGWIRLNPMRLLIKKVAQLVPIGKPIPRILAEARADHHCSTPSP